MLITYISAPPILIKMMHLYYDYEKRINNSNDLFIPFQTQTSIEMVTGSGHDEYDNKDDINRNIRSDKERQFIDRHKKWRELLLATLDEEAKIVQTPFLSFMTASNLGMVVLRAGSTSTLTISPKPDVNTYTNVVDKLDHLLETFLYDFQRHSSNKRILVHFEVKIWDIVSKAKLMFCEEAMVVDFINELIHYILVE